MEIKKEREERYPATCCSCGHEFQASKSLAMIMLGDNEKGHGACPNCNEFLNLTFVPEKGIMITKKWSEYLRGLK